MSFYILDETGNPVICDDILKWGEWFQQSDSRIVEQTSLHEGKVMVSTVFLAVDQSYGAEDDPVLWETMIFGGKHSEYQERYTSLVAARKGHQEAVALAESEEAE